MEIKSTAFENNGKIPTKYTCQGDEVNPELFFLNIPQDAKSLVLIMDDPDATIGTFTHWILFNLDPNLIKIEENYKGNDFLYGLNSIGSTEYIAPCPPLGTHRYFFKLYALNSNLPFKSGVDREEIENAIKNHIIEKTELVGLYAKQ